MAEVILQEIKDAEYNGAPYKKITTSGGVFNLKEKFKDVWPLLPECIGKSINLELGNYQGNPFIKSIKLPIGEATQPEQPIQKAPQKPASGTTELKQASGINRSIERQTCLIQAVLFANQKTEILKVDYKADDIIKVADRFWKWLDAGIIPNDNKSEPDPKPVIKAEQK
jgi:hypothetical protein